MKFFVGVVLLAILGLCSCQTPTPGFSFTVSSSVGGAVMSSIKLDGLKPASKFGVIHTDLGNVNLFVPSSGLVSDSITMGFLFEFSGFCELTYNTTSNTFGNHKCWLFNTNQVTTSQGFNAAHDFAFATYTAGSSNYNLTFSASKQGSSCAGFYYAHSVASVGSTPATISYLAGDLNGQGTLTPTATFGAYRTSTGKTVIDIPNAVSGAGATAVFAVGNSYTLCGFNTNPLYVELPGAFPCVELTAPAASADATCTYSANSYTAECSSTNGFFLTYTITSAINSVSCGST